MIHIQTQYNTKDKIRKYMRIIRKSLSIKQKYHASLKISLVSFNISYILKAKNIALFLPFDGEINTYPLIIQLWLKKKEFFFL